MTCRWTSPRRWNSATLAKRIAAGSLRDRGGEPNSRAEDPGQVGDRPAPKDGHERIPQHRPLVVEAVGADGLPESGIVLVVPETAGSRPAMRTDRIVPPLSARQHVSCSDHPAMDRTERGSGEGGEDARMVGQRSRYALGFIAGESSPCQGESVSTIHVRAGRAARRSAVSAGQKNDTGRFLVAAVSIDDFACLSIDRSRSPTRAMGEEHSFVRLSCSRTAGASVPYRADRALRDEGSELGASISAPSARLRDRSGTTRRRRPGLVGREGRVEGGLPKETGRYRSRRRQVHSLSHSLSLQMGLVSDAGRAFRFVGLGSAPCRVHDASTAPGGHWPRRCSGSTESRGAIGVGDLGRAPVTM